MEMNGGIAVAKIYRVSGPVVTAEGLDARMYDVVKVGDEKLLGEVIQIKSDRTVIQVYEDTSGLKPGEPVENTGSPLTVDLGPGLLTSIYDGIQRPLPALKAIMGDFILRGAVVPALDRKKKWHFVPLKKKGDAVRAGDVIGTVKEGGVIEHRILVPHGVEGMLTEIKEGNFTVEETIASVGTHELKLCQKWPIRLPRPVREKVIPVVPLLTGQRIIDALFPVAKGGTAAIPGPFGSGKCVTGDTKILADGKLVHIKRVFDNARGSVTESGEEKIIALERPLSVHTFDGEKIVETKATHVYKGKTKQVIAIKTRSGKKVKITPIHKLYKVDENLSIMETEAYRLKEGDYIISPRKLEMDADYQKMDLEFECRVADSNAIEEISLLIDSFTSERKITKKQLAALLGLNYKTLLNFYTKVNKPTLSFVKKLEKVTGKSIKISHIKTERQSRPIKIHEYMDEAFAEFLGYLMADGMIRGGETIIFFNKDARLRERFSCLAKELFGVETKEFWARTVEAVSISSRALINVLQLLDYPLRQKSNKINVPATLLNSPESVIKSFLVAYISCDGHVSRNDIEIATASKEMAEGIAYLLLRMGVLNKCSEKKVKGKVYYRIFIAPKEAIKIHPYYSKKYYCSSTDIVPMTSKLFRQILGTTKPWSLQKQGISTAGYYVDQNQTTETFQKITHALHSETLEKFAKALDYVHCDEITEIETINEETDVYDITVPETHNFIGGNLPMILHNTVAQQSLAKWSDASVIVYVGCGERGNEMTEVLKEFPVLVDPKSGKPLMERTVLIANTSNMPVAAREASIYTGVTIAEYFRDMGYDVALMADSTSRWAEAMREISSRLEEMPGEEGYPAYLSARLSEFYERAGKAVLLNGSEGSITVIGAVSPPGGDLSEPVTQATLRVTKAFWALDAKLANRRHFPSINWLTSYSQYEDTINEWYKSNVARDWPLYVREIKKLLTEEEKLQEIVQLIGSDALPEREQLTLDIARLIREFFLQQNAFHEVDAYSDVKKSYRIMTTIMHYGDQARAALKAGVPVKQIIAIKSKSKIGEAKFNRDYEAILSEAEKAIDSEINGLITKK
ncbi:MAG: V-type ATP synthase subunit A [Candidatus Aenigmarchaeota archaeon]|nr:V-type ATP synthase subunit A [Candidatus Aenigmarchaeota archaeon]